MDEKKSKLYNLYNDIFDTQINKYLLLSKKNKKIPQESLLFLESSRNSISNCLSLIKNDEYIDSLCLLRSSFESIMFSIAIHFDKEIYEMYKCYDKNIYIETLNKKYKKIKQENPKFAIPDLNKKKKEFLSPKRMRKIVADKYKYLFDELFADCKDEKEVLEELNDFYKYLCDFTHPSIVKTYVYKIQKDEKNLNNIRAIFMLNINFCKVLLLLTLNYFSIRDNISDIYDLYAIVFLLNINLVDNIDNLKLLLKRYDEYLYLNITRKYFSKNKRKIKEMQAEIRELNKDKRLDEKIGSIMNNIIIKYDATEIVEKYFYTHSL